MSENIENLKSVPKIRILANTTQTTHSMNYFKKWYKEILKRFTFWEIWRKVRKFDKITLFLFAKLLQISTIFKEAAQARKSSYWLDVAHAFTSYPKL